MEGKPICLCTTFDQISQRQERPLGIPSGRPYFQGNKRYHRCLLFPLTKAGERKSGADHRRTRRRPLVRFKQSPLLSRIVFYCGHYEKGSPERRVTVVIRPSLSLFNKHCFYGVCFSKRSFRTVSSAIHRYGRRRNEARHFDSVLPSFHTINIAFVRAFQSSWSDSCMYHAYKGSCKSLTWSAVPSAPLVLSKSHISLIVIG